MLRRRYRCAIMTALVAVLLFSLPGTALAALEDDPAYTSETNPGVGQDATWRWQWGNDTRPQLTVESVPSDGSVDDRLQTNGFIYEIRQLDGSGAGFAMPAWGTSQLSAVPENSTISGRYDLGSVVDRYGWTSYYGATKRGEGIFGLSTLFFNQFRVEDAASVNPLFLGIDLTKPTAVQGLSSSVSLLPNVGGKWTESAWRDYTWTPAAYDALSGVGGFRVLLDGEQAAFVHNVAPDPAYEPYAPLLNPIGPYLPQIRNVTIEDLPNGESTIEIVTVDRATNESTPAKVVNYVDNDTPTVKITTPKANAIVGPTPTFAVTAADGAGVSKVEYFVDGLLVGTSTTKPFSKTVNLSGFTTGTHTLTAKVYDMIGESAGSWVRPHTAQTSVSFKLDKVKPTLSRISGAPNPFYPRIREGYKDNFRVYYTANKPGTLKMVVKNSSGTVVRTLSKSVRAGRGSLLWNGRYTDGSVHKGTFRYYLSLTDAGGQKYTSSSRSVSIRFTQIVRVDNSSVRIVER